MSAAPRIDANLAEQVAHLSLLASQVASQLGTGVHLHRGQGTSVVFSHHRDYRPGDDPRHLDWRAYARTDAPVVKRYEHEARVRSMLLADGSRSMDFRGAEDRPTKREHAAVLLGGLALVLLRQGDEVEALRVSDGVDARHAARSARGDLAPLLETWFGESPREVTDLRAVADAVGAGTTGRRVIAWASDLLDPRDDALEALGNLTSAGHEVYLFHVLDPAELVLDSKGPTRFLGLEGEASVLADVDLRLAETYREAIEAFLDQARRTAASHGVRYTLARTDEPPAAALGRALFGAAHGL